jgi:diguanylate cyclase (GGDEF)-like protein/PAS domain S-box-containing protein
MTKSRVNHRSRKPFSQQLAAREDAPYSLPSDFTQAKALISALHAELRESETRRRQLEQKNRTLNQIVELADEGIAILDSLFNIRYTNAVMRRLLDRPAEAILGQSLPSLLSHLYDDLIATWPKQSDEGTTWCGGLDLVMRDGLRVPVQVTVKAIHDEGKLNGYIVLFLEMGEIKDTQDRVTVMRNLIEELSVETDTNILGNKALAAAMHLTGADVGIIALLDNDGRRFRFRWHCGFPEDFELIPVLRESHDIEGCCLSTIALTSGKAQLISDCQNCGQASGPFLRLGVGSAIVVPILARNGPVGVMKIANSSQTNYFDATNVPVLESIARQIGVALHRERLMDKLCASENRLRGIVEAVPEILFTASAPDLRFTLVSSAVEKIFGFTPAECLADPLIWQRQLHDDDRARVIKELQEGLAQHQDFSIESRAWHKDGVTMRWLLTRGSWQRDKAGQIIEVVGTMTDITALKEAEQNLTESENRFRMITASAKDGVVMVDTAGRITLWNPASESMFGYTAAEAVGCEAHRLLVPIRYQQAYRLGLQRFFANDHKHENSRTLEVTALRRDGREFSVEVSLSAVLVRGLWYAVALIRDISERKTLETRLRRAMMVFDNTRDGVVITDLKGNIIGVNRAFTDVTGYAEDEVLGHNPSLLQSGHQGGEFYQAMWRKVHEAGIWEGEIWNRRKNGEIYPEWLTINMVRDPAGHPSHYLGVFTDITRIKSSEEKLERLAHYDPLTDLPNRRLILSRLEHALEHASRHGHRIAVLYLDLDNFKQVNDSLGHHEGDELLVAVAQRLKGRLRQEDTFGRLGGDEFFLLLEAVPDFNEVAAMAQNLLALLATPFTLSNGNDVFVTASIGISVYPEDNITAMELMRDADAAMYRAKENGRNQYCFYTRDMNINALEIMELETALRGALERDELVLYYQPQVDTWSGKVTGAEALLRWQRQGFGLVPPGQFIPLAEKTGLILPIGRWVIDSACRQIREWLDEGLQVVRVAVNVSAKQFRVGDLENVLEQALSRYGVPAQYLEVELTESMLMEHPDEVVETLNNLKKIGVQLSLDDFGTGYSSLAYLSRFPLDALKIDQSFVRDIIVKPVATTIADSIIGLAQRMRLRVVAEGVEREEQLLFLRDRDCNEVQGFYLSRPLPVIAFTEILRQHLTLFPQPEAVQSPSGISRNN